jgi:hypothetical protein
MILGMRKPVGERQHGRRSLSTFCLLGIGPENLCHDKQEVFHSERVEREDEIARQGWEESLEREVHLDELLDRIDLLDLDQVHWREFELNE